MATFLMGIWMGCSVLLALMAIENQRFPNGILASPTDPASQIAKRIGLEDARLLLRHQAAEQNRVYFNYWEDAQILLGLILFACLFLGTQRRILPLTFCGLLLALVMFEHFGIAPDLTYSGREADFPPGSITFATQARVWALEQVYGWVEGLKLVLGAILASYLFVFRARQRVRKSASESERLSHSPINP